MILARHGNTFWPDETPTRCGARTDIPLVDSGQAQVAAIGTYLAREGLIPDVWYSGPMLRHKQTTSGAMQACGAQAQMSILEDFAEIDYGPDENKPEEDVIARIGQDAIDSWNTQTIVPQGWEVDPDAIIHSWLEFAAMAESKHARQRVFLASSNGVMRFIPHLTGDFKGFAAHNKIKISTGGVCILSKVPEATHWDIEGWNLRPQKLLLMA